MPSAVVALARDPNGSVAKLRSRLRSVTTCSADPGPAYDIVHTTLVRFRSSVFLPAEAVEQVAAIELAASVVMSELRLVTIGRAFHWMDRAQTVASLDPLILPGGAIALFGERYPEVGHNIWYPAFRSLVDSYSTNDPAHGRTRGLSPHEGVLLDTGFNHLERVSVLEARSTPVEHIVDRALSFGAAWDGKPGSRENDLAQEVRALVSKHAENGRVQELIEGHALVAFRSRDVQS